MLHSVANTLGHELWQSILTGGSLCVVDVLNFSRTSKSFWSVAQEDVIWHWLYCTEFATAEDVQPNRPWKAIYKSRCMTPGKHKEASWQAVSNDSHHTCCAPQGT